MQGENYKEFVEKFKPKKTTDDCYTPPNIYNTILNWVKKEYNIEKRPIIRPFYPGGDYEKYEYPENCVVVDNPPFSIFTKIVEYYSEKRIPFFLFGPGLTLFTPVKKTDSIQFVICGYSITYGNGAKVNTSFITNLGGPFIRTAPELYRAIKEADKRNSKAQERPC